MDAERTGSECCTSLSRCRIESMVTVDERGQMVLPKDLRDRARIRAGDKYALVSWEKKGEVCCISLIRAEDLSSLVKDFLGPVVSEIWET